MSKTHRDHQIVLRIAEPLREILESEAAADSRNLSSLIRKILVDHAAHRITSSEAKAA